MAKSKTTTSALSVDTPLVSENPVRVIPFAKHLALLESVNADIVDALDSLAARVQKVGSTSPKDSMVPQEALAALFLVRELKKKIDKVEKSAADTFKNHIANKGKVEQGEYAASVTTTDYNVPDWKGEAISLAREIAEKNGRMFSAEVYESEVKARTEPEPRTSMKVFKVGGV